MESTTTYLSLGQAAHRLGLSRQRVSALVRAGRLPAILTPLGRLYRTADLARYSAERRQNMAKKKGAAR